MFLNHTKMFSNQIFKFKRKLKLICERCNHNKSFDTKRNLNVLFFGTDKFSLASLEALVKEQSYGTVKNLNVVTSFKSTSNPVKSYAASKNLVCFDWPISNDICKSFDVGIVVSFGHLIPEAIISSFPLGIINVHASLLPRWRGAAPIIYAIMNGDKKTGVSLMRILPKHFDIGEILAQKEVPINESCLMPELHNELSNVGASLLVDCLRDLEYRLKNARPQTPDEVTYAPKVTPALAEVNWNSTANEVYNLYRALYSFTPLLTKWNNLQLKLFEMKMPASDSVSIKVSGTVEYSKLHKCLNITCGDGRTVCVYKLSLEGKKIMSAADFNNGFLKKFIGKNYFI